MTSHYFTRFHHVFCTSRIFKSGKQCLTWLLASIYRITVDEIPNTSASPPASRSGTHRAVPRAHAKVPRVGVRGSGPSAIQDDISLTYSKCFFLRESLQSFDVFVERIFTSCGKFRFSASYIRCPWPKPFDRANPTKAPLSELLPLMEMPLKCQRPKGLFNMLNMLRKFVANIIPGISDSSSSSNSMTLQ